MNQQELLNFHEKICQEGAVLMSRKNDDYGANGDAFHNFRMASLLGLDPAQGVLLRMQDKMARLVTFLGKGKLSVADETWRDSVVDIINYAVILACLFGEKGEPTRSSLNAGYPDPMFAWKGVPDE